MRFIDYNGSGGLDPQDIATSVAVEEAARKDDQGEKPADRQLSGNPGCAAMAALIAFAILILIAAL